MLLHDRGLPLAEHRVPAGAARESGRSRQDLDEARVTFTRVGQAPGRRALDVPVRLALTVALVYALHFTTNVVRETYLAVAIAEDGSIRVDRFLGLHPDLFEIP